MLAIPLLLPVKAGRNHLTELAEPKQVHGQKELGDTMGLVCVMVQRPQDFTNARPIVDLQPHYPRCQILHIHEQKWMELHLGPQNDFLIASLNYSRGVTTTISVDKRNIMT